MRKLLLLTLLFFCEQNKDTQGSIIESKIIELSFDSFDLSGYNEKKYFQIDSIIVSHSENFLNRGEVSDTIYLPSFMYVIAQAHKKKIMEKTNTFELSFILGKKLTEKNKNYQIVNLNELITKGNLVIQRVDQKKIKLVIPRDYRIISKKRE